MYRKIDMSGRICVPSEMREKIDLDVNSEVKIELLDNEIIITNAKKEDTLNDLKEKIKSLSKKNVKDKELVIEDIMNTIDTLK